VILRQQHFKASHPRGFSFPEFHMAPTPDRGIRWLAVFEQVAGVLIVSAVLGIAAVYQTTIATNTAVWQLVTRFERFEEKTDQRIQKLESDVQQIKIDMAKMRSANHE
jgi:hypothetical protein